MSYTFQSFPLVSVGGFGLGQSTAAADCLAWVQQRYDYAAYDRYRTAAAELRRRAPEWPGAGALDKPAPFNFVDQADYERYLIQAAQFVRDTHELMVNAGKTINLPPFWLIPWNPTTVTMDAQDAIVRMGGYNDYERSFGGPSAPIPGSAVVMRTGKLRGRPSERRDVRYHHGAVLTVSYTPYDIVTGRGLMARSASGTAARWANEQELSTAGLATKWLNFFSTDDEHMPWKQSSKLVPPIARADRVTFDGPRIAVARAKAYLSFVSSRSGPKVVENALKVWAAIFRKWVEHPVFLRNVAAHPEAHAEARIQQAAAMLEGAGTAAASVGGPYGAAIGAVLIAMAETVKLFPGAVGTICIHTVPGMVEEHKQLGFICGPPLPALEWPEDIPGCDAFMAPRATVTERRAIDQAARERYMADISRRATSLQWRDFGRKVVDTVSNPFVGIPLLALLGYGAYRVLTKEKH